MTNEEKILRELERLNSKFELPDIYLPKWLGWFLIIGMSLVAIGVLRDVIRYW